MELDSSPSFIKILEDIKENLNEIKYYAEDFSKRNAITKKTKGSSIRHKLKAICYSLNNYTHLIESLA
jgi:hypothetical protein